MNSFTSILLIAMVNIVFTANRNPGHLKAFGSVGSRINIDEIPREYPTISKFFIYHIAQSEPIVSRQVLNNDRHYSIWETDKQLLQEVYGLADTNILVQSFKPRQQQQVQMTFKDFLSRYRREPLLFADQVPTILQKYLTVPKPFQCDAVLDTVQSIILLMNGMNVSPLIFQEEHDYLHCLLRGSKRFVLVNTLKYPDVRKIVVSERREQRGPPVNPERVDFNQFPALADVDYHLANLTAGDCLLIPSGWVFQERSLENSIGILYNIKHYLAATIDPEELKVCPEYDSTFTLDQIDWSTEHAPTNFKELIMDLINSKMTGFDQWQDGFSKYLTYDIALDPEVSALFEEFFALVDIDANGEINEIEIEQIAGEHLRHITHILYEMTKTINTNRKKNTPKPIDISNHQQTTNIHLHSQTAKTDL